MFLSTNTNMIYLILHAFFIFLNMKSKLFLVSAILHHISVLRLLPKSYFKISTFQPNCLCSSSIKGTRVKSFGSESTYLTQLFIHQSQHYAIYITNKLMC